MIQALYGPNYTFNDSALASDWGRFLCVLCPLTDEVIEFVGLHGIDTLFRETGVPVDLAYMTFDRSQVVDWKERNPANTFSKEHYFRCDPFAGGNQ